jgi:hypothetical protein
LSIPVHSCAVTNITQFACVHLYTPARAFGGGTEESRTPHPKNKELSFFVFQNQLFVSIVRPHQKDLKKFQSEVMMSVAEASCAPKFAACRFSRRLGVRNLRMNLRIGARV